MHALCCASKLIKCRACDRCPWCTVTFSQAACACIQAGARVTQRACASALRGSCCFTGPRCGIHGPPAACTPLTCSPTTPAPLHSILPGWRSWSMLRWGRILPTVAFQERRRTEKVCECQVLSVAKNTCLPSVGWSLQELTAGVHPVVRSLIEWVQNVMMWQRTELLVFGSWM